MISEEYPINLKFQTTCSFLLVENEIIFRLVNELDSIPITSKELEIYASYSVTLCRLYRAGSIS